MDQKRVILLTAAVGIAGAIMVGVSYSELLLAHPPEGGIATVQVTVQDRHDHVLFDDTVTLDRANALAALDVASREGNFTIDVRRTHEYESVTAINGTETNDTHQWTYRWSRGGDAWCWGDRPAADQPLRDGDRLLWVWVEKPVEAGGCG